MRKGREREGRREGGRAEATSRNKRTFTHVCTPTAQKALVSPWNGGGNTLQYNPLISDVDASHSLHYTLHTVFYRITRCTVHSFITEYYTLQPVIKTHVLYTSCVHVNRDIHSMTCYI